MEDYRHSVLFDLPVLDDRLKEKVEKYFQIRRKSGGGECGAAQHVGGTTFRISFRDQDAQRRVLEKGSHVVETSSGSVPLSVRQDPGPASAASTAVTLLWFIYIKKCVLLLVLLVLVLLLTNIFFFSNFFPKKMHDFPSATVMSPDGQHRTETFPLDPYLIRYLRDCPKAASQLRLLLSPLSSTFQLEPEEEKVLVRHLAQTGQTGKWKDQIRQVFEAIQDKYTCHYLTDQLKLQTLVEAPYLGSEDVKVYKEPGEGFAVVVGEDDKVQEHLLQLEIRKEVKSQATQMHVSTSCLVGEAKLSLLWKELELDLKRQFPGIQVCQAGYGRVTIKGPTANVRSACEMVRSRAAEVHEKQVPGLSSALLSFLRAQGAKALNSTLARFQVTAELTDSGLCLLSLSEEALVEAQRVLHSQIVEEEVFVPDLPNVLPRLMKELQVEELQLNQDRIRVKVCYQQCSAGDASCIQLLGYREPVSQLKNITQQLLEDQEMLQTSVDLSFPEVWDHLSDLLTQLSVDHTGVQFSLSTSQQPSKVVLKGPKHLVMPVSREVSRVLGSLVQEVFTIYHPGSLRYFRGPGHEYLQVVGRNHSCLVQLQGSSAPEEPSYLLEAGLCVHVRHGDITQERADALVNAANEDLEHSGGVAGALSLAGGPEVQRASQELVRRNGRVRTGTAVATSPGQLPCKVLVHAVGPVWSGVLGARGKVRADLESAVRAALEVAESTGCRSLAMPCISSGIFGVPLDLCASALVTAVRDFGRTSRMLQMVTLLDTNAEAVRAMQIACDTLLGRRKPPASSTIEHTDTGRLESSFAHVEGASVVEALVQVKVVMGNIEDQEVDVLVAPMLSLNPQSTTVGKCLMGKAGDGLGKGFEQATRGRRTVPGDVVLVEMKGALNVCCVFFVHCERWTSTSHSSAAEVLRKGVRNVLNLCENWGFVSVAFPVIGAGHSMGFPHSLAAQVLLEEIQLHEKKRTSNMTLSIFIVIHPSDKQSAAAFEASQNAVRLRGFEMSISPERMPFYHCISLAQDEISVMMGGIKLQLVFGDIVKETTDVIVNSTNFMSEQIGVSKAILSAAGKDVQDEFFRVKARADGICYTQAGALSCRTIVHIFAKQDLDLVKKLCSRVLKFCEQNGYASVAFPAVCAGGAGLSAPEVASSMLDGFACTVRDSFFAHLSLIRIVLLLRPVFETFRSKLESRLGDRAPSLSLKERAKKMVKQIQRKEPEASRFANSPLADGPRLTLASLHPLPAVVCVTGPGQQALQGVHRDLEAVMQKQLYERELDAEELAQLSLEDLASLVEQAKERELSLQQEWRGEGTATSPRPYVVRGLKEEVLEFCEAFHQGMRRAACRKLQEREELLIFLSVNWMIISPSGEWKEMELKDNYILEQKYQEDNGSVVNIDCPKGEVLTVDLRKMEATYRNSGLTSQVKRMEQHTDYNLPSTWDPMAPGEFLRKVLLQPTSAEYRKVHDNFMKSAGQHNIHKIERVQNIHLWRAYWGKLQQFVQKNGEGSVAENLLYHGTSATACDSIERGGFNRNFAGKHATRYGVGVYFAVQASYSANAVFSPADQNGLHYVYVARVLAGHYTVGTADMRMPPVRPNSNPPDRFDSVVDVAHNPNMFVIFHDDQAYPDYLITFR
ncbi:poly ADP-ribose polymerase 14-like [Arapaima gigas]